MSVKPGDTVWCVLPENWNSHSSNRIAGTVRRVSPRRIHVWFGHTGLGQRVWPFDAKGAPVGETIGSLIGDGKLDLPA